MLEVGNQFKMVTKVHKEYHALLPVEQQDKDEDWFDEIDASILQFIRKIHGGSEMLGGKVVLPWKQSQKGQVCLQVCHQRSQVDIQVCHHQVIKE